MTSLRGNAAAIAAFDAAMTGGKPHHAWLIAGPQGVGKGAFAREAARRILTRAAPLPNIDDLIAAGSHPDYRELVRLPKDPEKPEQDIARSIRIDQVRALQPVLATKPALSPVRVIVIDAIDDLERPAANALLKNLEEPPTGTIFLLVSHAPGRLLPTIRSRCRLLRFAELGDDDMAAVLREAVPEASEAEIAALVRAGAESPGRALAFAGLDMAAIERDLAEIARTGDPDSVIRVRLAGALSGKAAQARYEAFLTRTPSFIAEQARGRSGGALKTALDAYARTRSIAAAAIGLSQDVVTTVFELAAEVATLAPTGLQPGETMH